MNCSNDLKIFANSQPSALNFKSFPQPLEQFFLTVCQNNFGNKIPFFQMDNISYRKKAPVSLTSMMNMAKTKSKMAKDARENMQIKEEEQLTKRTKTILDKEHAITEQQKIKETR